jgi:NADP-dependent 3-hydroxy acid dehydrogenase YdfG
MEKELGRLQVFIKPLKMDLTEGSETSANINQTPRKHPKVDTLNTEHGESLKSRI